MSMFVRSGSRLCRAFPPISRTVAGASLSGAKNSSSFMYTRKISSSTLLRSNSSSPSSPSPSPASSESGGNLVFFILGSGALLALSLGGSGGYKKDDAVEQKTDTSATPEKHAKPIAAPLATQTTTQTKPKKQTETLVTSTSAAPTPTTQSADDAKTESLSETEKKKDESDAIKEHVEGEAEAEEEHPGSAAFDPETGEINWDCPCLGGMAHGPCGEEFRAAFSCFVYSEQEPKGMECLEKFKTMQNCFKEHPDVYGEEDASALEEEEPRGELADTNTDAETPK